jgi:hypothetical protein
MRTMYQASPWKAANGPFFRSSAFDRHMPERLGDPSAYFSGERFLPTRSGGAPVLGRALVLPNQRIVHAPSGLGQGDREGVDVTRPICRCDFTKHGANLGQACSAPTAGGSGSAEFGAGDAAPSGGPKMETILVAGAVGVGVLLLLGVL